VDPLAQGRHGILVGEVASFPERARCVADRVREPSGIRSHDHHPCPGIEQGPCCRPPRCARAPGEDDESSPDEFLRLARVAHTVSVVVVRRGPPSVLRRGSERDHSRVSRPRRASPLRRVSTTRRPAIGIDARRGYATREGVAQSVPRMPSVEAITGRIFFSSASKNIDSGNSSSSTASVYPFGRPASTSSDSPRAQTEAG